MSDSGIPQPRDETTTRRAVSALRQIVLELTGKTRVSSRNRAVTYADLIALGLVTATEVDVYLQSAADTGKQYGRA